MGQQAYNPRHANPQTGAAEMKYVLIAIFIGSVNDASMQEFDSIEACENARKIMKKSYSYSFKYNTGTIETHCVKK